MVKSQEDRGAGERESGVCVGVHRCGCGVVREVAKALAVGEGSESRVGIRDIGIGQGGEEGVRQLGQSSR
jgi:hypothetical protein